MSREQYDICGQQHRKLEEYANRGRVCSESAIWQCHFRPSVRAEIAGTGFPPKCQESTGCRYWWWLSLYSSPAVKDPAAERLRGSRANMKRDREKTEAKNSMSSCRAPRIRSPSGRHCLRNRGLEIRRGSCCVYSGSTSKELGAKRTPSQTRRGRSRLRVILSDPWSHVQRPLSLEVDAKGILQFSRVDASILNRSHRSQPTASQGKVDGNLAKRDTASKKQAASIRQVAAATRVRGCSRVAAPSRQDVSVTRVGLVRRVLTPWLKLVVIYSGHQHPRVDADCKPRLRGASRFRPR